jgi:hypothetical protein
MSSSATSRITTAANLVRLASSYAAFTVLKHIAPLQTLARLAWTAPRNGDPSRRGMSTSGVVWIGRVAGASRGDCLQRALLLYRELSRAGDRPVLVAGLRQDGARREGHAWVEVNGVPVADALEDVNRFTRLVSFGEKGRPIRTSQDERGPGAATAPD